MTCTARAESPPDSKKLVSPDGATARPRVERNASRTLRSIKAVECALPTIGDELSSKSRADIPATVGDSNKSLSEI